MIELKPCPFCGGEAEYLYFASSRCNFVKVQCKTCRSSTRAFVQVDEYRQQRPGEEQAGNFWNRRDDNG